MMERSETAVRLRDVTVSFAGRVVVDSVSLALPRRGVSVFIGRSGSGKTTLLRVLNRLNEEFPGSVTTGGVELDLGNGLEPVYPEMGPKTGRQAGRAVRPLPELRRRVGMVFQSPNVFPASVYRNLELPLSLAARCSRRQRAERVEAALRDAGLWDEVRDRLDMPAERLSGGQQQRLCLARALVLEPDILLVDEPTASLDVHAAAAVETLLARLAERLPVVMVSHSLDQTLRLGRTVLVMNQGRLTHCLDAAHIGGESDLAELLGGPPA